MRQAIVWLIEDLMLGRDDCFEAVAGVETRHWLHVVLTGPPSESGASPTLVVAAQTIDGDTRSPLPARNWGGGGDRFESLVTAKFVRPGPGVTLIEVTMCLDDVVCGRTRLRRPAPQA